MGISNCEPTSTLWWKGGLGTTYLAGSQVDEGVVAEDDGDIRFGLGLALVHGSGFLQVNGPCNYLLGVIGHLELKNAVGLEGMKIIHESLL